MPLSPWTSSLAGVCLYAFAAGLGAAAVACGTGEDHAEHPTPPAHEFSVRPPMPPKTYSLPRNAIRVTNSGQLRSALSNRSPRDVILANGTYDNGSPFNPAAPHRLWAENLGKAVLKTGLIFRAGPGAEVHGIHFDVKSDKKGKDAAIVRSHGSGHGIKIMDSWFDGNGIMNRAIEARAINGVVLQRLVIRGFQRDGIRITDYPNNHTPKPPALLTDLDIANIKHKDPKCCNGTAEAGIWLGTSGTVERVKVRNADWMCVIPVSNANDAVWRDLDLDGCPTGIYFEHYARRNTVERFRIGSNVKKGINFESGQSRWNWQGVGPGNIVQDGFIESRIVGINMPYCTEQTTVRRVRFKGQCFAGIAHSAVRSYGQCKASSGATNRISDNDYAGVKAGAADINTRHPNEARCD
jgi:hypothetical protein